MRNLRLLCSTKVSLEIQLVITTITRSLHKYQLSWLSTIPLPCKLPIAQYYNTLPLRQQVALLIMKRREEMCF
jgi:hypothetical protein